ncbi:hypothetical protein FE810_02855 [Thalassotalea litorea]|uniref:Uncharacterized protein n=1 Tax=Thalassotalea litorea TaxID=2020715 RepID=A0A5R9IRK0_9GAMM|nr:hypothetical protein [Thalassotalea litorea]TLU67239.1 hypothetical protein FE810_02855 [Thalassotalea litorea]
MQIIGLLIFIFIVYGLMQFWVYKWGISKYGKLKAKNIAKVIAFLIPISIVIIRELSEPDIEWNPILRSDEAIIGLWVDTGETLDLKPDGTFDFYIDSKKYSGTWKRNDWNLSLTSSGSFPYFYLRVIEHSGSYHLVKDTYNKDPDAWFYQNSLSKKKSP